MIAASSESPLPIAARVRSAHERIVHVAAHGADFAEGQSRIDLAHRRFHRRDRAFGPPCAPHLQLKDGIAGLRRHRGRRTESVETVRGRTCIASRSPRPRFRRLQSPPGRGRFRTAALAGCPRGKNVRTKLWFTTTGAGVRARRRRIPSGRGPPRSSSPWHRTRPATPCWCWRSSRGRARAGQRHCCLKARAAHQAARCRAG